MSTLWMVIASPVALVLNIILIGLLIARELLRGTQRPVLQRVRRMLGIACVPLLVVFVATVVVRLGNAQANQTAATDQVASAVTSSKESASSTTGAFVGSPFAPAAATSPAPPTATAAPTTDPTTAPTTTSPPTTAVPTPTASFTAPAVVAAERIDLRFDTWPVRESTTAAMRSTDERYQLVLNGQPFVGASSVLPVTNYRLQIDLAITAGEAGVVFLAQQPATFFRIMFNTHNEYALQEVNDATVRNIVGWTPSPVPTTATPLRLRIERYADQVQVFVDDQALTTFTVPAAAEGNHVGVALTSPTEQGEATFSNLIVERLAAAP